MGASPLFPFFKGTVCQYSEYLCDEQDGCLKSILLFLSEFFRKGANISSLKKCLQRKKKKR